MKPLKKLDFPYAIRSFIGYLEGTEKSLHTIKNYRLDLLAFQDFLQNHLAPQARSLEQVEAKDLERYHDHLKSLGLKTNTRRRKLMTLRRFLSFLAARKKLRTDLGKSLPTPYKSERIPVTVPAANLLKAIRELPGETEVDLRTRILFRTLLETGCLISEAAKIRWSDLHAPRAGHASLEFSGKNPRKISVSEELWNWVQELRKYRKGECPWVFQGFNRHGSLGQPISSRGIEILVRASAARLGYPDIIPRTFRHSAVLGWFQDGLSEQVIQQRLGLKSDYAFRGYAPLRKGT